MCIQTRRNTFKWHLKHSRCNQGATRNIIPPLNSRIYTEEVGFKPLYILGKYSKRAARNTTGIITG